MGVLTVAMDYSIQYWQCNTTIYSLFYLTLPKKVTVLKFKISLVWNTLA